MKKLFLLASVTFSLIAADVKWSSLNDGIDLAQKDNKLMLIMMTSPTCGYCVKMENQVLKDDKVAESLNKFFIPIKIDMSKKDYPPSLSVKGTPTFFFSTKDNVIVEKVVGYREVPEFLDILTKAMMRRE